MTSKELINNTFDKVISDIKKQQLTEQVLDASSIEQTDKNITDICKENLK